MRRLPRCTCKPRSRDMPSCSITWGKMYENGYGVEQDYVKAAAWYQLVAEQGFLDLQQFYAF